jgi:hypothetical protein
VFSLHRGDRAPSAPLRAPVALRFLLDRLRVALEPDVLVDLTERPLDAEGAERDEPVDAVEGVLDPGAVVQPRAPLDARGTGPRSMAKYSSSV